jgi:hypothetical protein
VLEELDLRCARRARSGLCFESLIWVVLGEFDLGASSMLDVLDSRRA